MVWLRACGLRSSVQSCSAETVAFHIEYVHAKGQYCEASMGLVCRWNKIMEWRLTQSLSVYIVAEGISVKESQFAFDGFELVDPSQWHMSFDVVAHASCTCVSSMVKNFCSLSVNLEVHMVDHGNKWLLFFNYKSVISLSVKESQFAFDGFELVDPSQWHMSFDVVAHDSCTCVSSKVKNFCSLSVNLEVHMVDHGNKWLLFFNYKSVISLRDAVAGPILSLTTNHVCSSCFQDFGSFYPMIQLQELLLTVLVASVNTLFRFPFHMQVMILIRSYNRLCTLAITSVDGCCLYIIIHNSMLPRTWL